MRSTASNTRRIGRWSAALAMLAAVVACTVANPRRAEQHRWWAGFGLVVPHESFPADCSLCHVGSSWNKLVLDFRFDHGARTGVALHGVHDQAACLRCHNDRGPVATFAAKGCVGCHEDVHYGELGQDCARCHDEVVWRVPNTRVAHLHTRLPLIGAHMQVACHRCHAGATVTNFRPTDPDCASCHLNTAIATSNPPHQGLGWTQQRCDRCHTPTAWRPAQVR
ncbi:MAG: hypothetical protein KAI24_20690 [Planctomycetes bacterium]|nr:hypothetical protein [Planctomycetota bacterium]